MNGVSVQGRSSSATYMPNSRFSTGTCRRSTCEFYGVRLPLWRERQGFFHKRGEITRAQRDHFVVEIEMRVVQEAAAGAAPLAQPDIGAGTLEQQVGKVLAAHRRVRVGDDVAGTEHPLPDAPRQLPLPRP